jgi:hypothetical protein
MSALGQKQTSQAIIAESGWHVRFVPKADMRVFRELLDAACPFS